MSLDLLNGIALHAGTPPLVSQITLMAMFIVLGCGLIGIGFGRLVKAKGALQEHRWIMTVSVILMLGAVMAVMIPTFIHFYLDPDVEVFSVISITTIVHTIVGAPALVTAVFYAVGALPRNSRMWMRVTTVLWATAIIVGVIMFIQMMTMAGLL